MNCKAEGAAAYTLPICAPIFQRTGPQAADSARIIARQCYCTQQIAADRPKSAKIAARDECQGRADPTATQEIISRVAVVRCKAEGAAAYECSRQGDR